MDGTSKQPRAVRCSAPGRINLIGEHTDYTGGLVLPIAIPFQTTVTVTAAEDDLYLLSSEQFDSLLLKRSDSAMRTGTWSDYVVGVLEQLRAIGIDPPPFHLSVDGRVPVGAGLSSSASITVASALALLRFSGERLGIRELAMLCQRAENLFVGSPCGIMDQFVVVAAEPGHALLLNTRNLEYGNIPLGRGALSDCVLVMVNSAVGHSVSAGSSYASRRAELEQGQAVLQERTGVADLGQATLDQLQACATFLPRSVYRRCRHVVRENGRVRFAADSLVKGDAARLGELMTESHASQRDDFECSVPEIDFLIDRAYAQRGCYGARLTGGGFGGCTVNLVERAHATAFQQNLLDSYMQVFGRQGKAYVCEAAAGALAQERILA